LAEVDVELALIPARPTGYEPGLLSFIYFYLNHPTSPPSNMALSQSFLLPEQRRLHGVSNYRPWSIDVKVLLVDHGSWGIVDGTKLPPTEKADLLQKYKELL
jgi:hypothetical protein